MPRGRLNAARAQHGYIRVELGLSAGECLPVGVARRGQRPQPGGQHRRTPTSYGVATWNGFADGLFTVPQLDRLATEAAGRPEHHLRLVQLPVSLVMADHLGESLHGYGPIHQAADRGWEVHASAPLHGGELLTLATPEVAALVKEGATGAAARLAAAAPCPGVTRVLLSASTPAHWTDALTVTAAPAIPPDTLRTAATPG